MEPKKFYNKLDQAAKEWYIDANEPVRGTYKTTKTDQLGPRRKTDHKGQTAKANTTSGQVQILKWACQEHICVQCCKMVSNQIEEINLRSGQVKCSCGLKYPIIDHVLKKVEHSGSQRYIIDQKVRN